MKLRPVSELTEPRYPKRNPGNGRHLLFNTIAAAGIGVSVVSAVLAEETTERKEDKGKSEIVIKIGEQIASLTAKLGDNDYKVRREAMRELIELGNKKGEDDNYLYRADILKAVTPLKKNKDPEVATRANEICTALTCKPVTRPRPELRGKVRL